MADIQSATAEIRRGKKEDGRLKIEETTGQNIMACLSHRVAITRNAKSIFIAVLKTFKDIELSTWIIHCVSKNIQTF